MNTPTPVAPFPSATGQLISVLVWLVLPLGLLGYLLVIPALRRSVADHFRRAVNFAAPPPPPPPPPAAPPAPTPAAPGIPDAADTADVKDADNPADSEMLAAILTAWDPPADQPPR